MRTKYLLLTLGAVSALAISGPANAAHVVVDGTTLESVSAPNEGPDFTTIAFNDNNLVENFSETLTFTSMLDGLYFLVVNSSAPNVDFTNIFISGISGTFNLTKVDDDGFSESWRRSNLLLGAGQYTLTMNGATAGAGAGALAGNVTIGQAVPEPGTWAMMLLGFGAIGFAMRRRKQAEGTKRIRLSYS